MIVYAVPELAHERTQRWQRTTLIVLAAILLLCNRYAMVSMAQYQRIFEEQRQEVEQMRQITTDHSSGKDDPAALPPHVLFIITLEPTTDIIISRVPNLPVSAIVDEYEQFQEALFQERILGIQQTNPNIDVIQARVIARRELRSGPFLEGLDIFAGQPNPQYQLAPLLDRDTVYGVGFSYPEYRSSLHNTVLPPALSMLLITMAFLLLIVVKR